MRRNFRNNFAWIFTVAVIISVTLFAAYALLANDSDPPYAYAYDTEPYPQTEGILCVRYPEMLAHSERVWSGDIYIWIAEGTTCTTIQTSDAITADVGGLSLDHVSIVADLPILVTSQKYTSRTSSSDTETITLTHPVSATGGDILVTRVVAVASPRDVADQKQDWLYVSAGGELSSIPLRLEPPLTIWWRRLKTEFDWMVPFLVSLLFILWEIRRETQRRREEFLDRRLLQLEQQWSQQPLLAHDRLCKLHGFYKGTDGLGRIEATIDRWMNQYDQCGRLLDEAIGKEQERVEAENRRRIFGKILALTNFRNRPTVPCSEPGKCKGITEAHSELWNNISIYTELTVGAQFPRECTLSHCQYLHVGGFSEHFRGRIVKVLNERESETLRIVNDTDVNSQSKENDFASLYGLCFDDELSPRISRQLRKHVVIHQIQPYQVRTRSAPPQYMFSFADRPNIPIDYDVTFWKSDFLAFIGHTDWLSDDQTTAKIGVSPSPCDRLAASVSLLPQKGESGPNYKDTFRIWISWSSQNSSLLDVIRQKWLLALADNLLETPDLYYSYRTPYRVRLLELMRAEIGKPYSAEWQNLDSHNHRSDTRFWNDYAKSQHDDTDSIEPASLAEMLALLPPQFHRIVFIIAWTTPECMSGSQQDEVIELIAWCQTTGNQVQAFLPQRLSIAPKSNVAPIGVVHEDVSWSIDQLSKHLTERVTANTRMADVCVDGGAIANALDQLVGRLTENRIPPPPTPVPSFHEKLVGNAEESLAKLLDLYGEILQNPDDIEDKLA